MACLLLAGMRNGFDAEAELLPFASCGFIAAKLKCAKWLLAACSCSTSPPCCASAAIKGASKNATKSTNALFAVIEHPELRVKGHWISSRNHLFGSSTVEIAALRTEFTPGRHRPFETHGEYSQEPFAGPSRKLQRSLAAFGTPKYTGCMQRVAPVYPAF